jgi:hypothetical protein
LDAQCVQHLRLDMNVALIVNSRIFVIVDKSVRTHIGKSTIAVVVTVIETLKKTVYKMKKMSVFLIIT